MENNEKLLQGILNELKEMNLFLKSISKGLVLLVIFFIILVVLNILPIIWVTLRF